MGAMNPLLTRSTNRNASRGAFGYYNPTNAQGGVTNIGNSGGGGSSSAMMGSASGAAAITQFNQRANDMFFGRSGGGSAPMRGGGGSFGDGGGGGGAGGLTDPRVLLANRDKAMAALETEMAAEAVRDGERTSERAARALANNNSRTGGGAFSRMRRGRTGVALGGLLTGGLAAANRNKLREAKTKEIEAGFQADQKRMGYKGDLAKRFKWDKPVS